MLTLYGCASVADAQVDQVLPAIGGGGGGQFVARCRPSEILSGFELHTGDDVDAVRALRAAPPCPAPTARLHKRTTQSRMSFIGSDSI